ncbi:MAG: flippase-like domain-containing protein [Acidobacteria bacterium]|nr:flippase-like domain-containing protein [Acidobacteriota bacterium]MCG3192902.1 hypothetical protein [Thermoanaerobaculia bacterium]MCK6683067.1 flippase-like domain-containing protein [Thermoanaerobaculia bacterium]
MALSPRSKKALNIGISLGLTALLLTLFLRNLDFAQVGHSIRNADPLWLGSALVASLVVIPIRSWRWTILLHHAGPLRQTDAIAATCIGFAATTLLPARAGEVVRPVALARMSDKPVSPFLASVGLERLIDLIVILLLFLAFALGGYMPQGLAPAERTAFLILQRSAYLAGTGSIIVLAVMTFLAVRRDLRTRWASKFLSFLPERFEHRLRPILMGLLQGLDALDCPKRGLLLASSSIFMWLVICLQLYATLRAFEFNFPFPITFWVLAWGILGLAIPTPGGVGGYHKAVAYSLTGFYGASTSEAAGFAIVSHAVSFVPITILGLAFLALQGTSFGRLAAESDSSPVPEKGAE